MRSNKPRASRPRADAQSKVAQSSQIPATQNPTPRTPEQIAQFTYQEQTTGYLVPPTMLERYEIILPGFSARWLSMAERQEAHRQSLERHTIIGDGRRAWAGIIVAAIICLATISAAVIVALARHDPGAAVLSGFFGTAGLLGLASVFVYGTRSRRQERVEKARIMTRQQ